MKIILRFTCENGCAPWEREIDLDRDSRLSACPNCHQWGTIVGRRPA